MAGLERDYLFLTGRWARRLARACGTNAHRILGGARSAADPGRDFGTTLTQAELRWLMEREFARSAEDVLWRRSKLGLRLTQEEARAIEAWMRDAQDGKRGNAPRGPGLALRR